MSRPLTIASHAARAVCVVALGVVLAACGSAGPSGAGTTHTATQGSESGGNGIENKSVDEIATAVRAAVASASSVHMAGTTSDGAMVATIGKTGADVQVTVPGKGVVQVRAVQSAYYIKADKAFWASETNPAAAAMLAGKWVKVPTSAADSFKSFLNLQDLSKDAFTPTGTVTKGAPTTVAGQQALPLTDADGTLYVALQGQPYPVKVVNTKGDSTGTIVFSNWNVAVTIPAPPPSQVVDITKITG